MYEAGLRGGNEEPCQDRHIGRRDSEIIQRIASQARIHREVATGNMAGSARSTFITRYRAPLAEFKGTIMTKTVHA